MTWNTKITSGLLFVVVFALRPQLAFTQPQLLRPTHQFAEGESVGSFFGLQIAVVGDVVAIAARDDDRYATNGGAVYIYDSDGSFLTVVGSPNAQEGGEFGSYMTPVGDDRFLVGANFENDAAGNAYLFDIEGKLIKSFSSPNPSPGGQFGGRFLLANNESIFIPAWNEQQVSDDQNIYKGAVYKYTQDGNLVDTITNVRRDADGVNCMGRSAAFVGDDKIVIGDACSNGPADLNEAGAAYLFGLEGNLLQSFDNPNPSTLDQFGSSVAYADGRILSGGTQIDDLETGASTGAAYIFEADGTLVTRVNDPEPQGGNWFGWNAGSMTLQSGEEVFLIGSIFNNAGAGKAFLVNRDGKILQALESPSPGPSEHFGTSFAQLGNKLLVGETHDGGGFPDGKGAVWVFEPADLGDFDLDGDVDLTDLETLCGDLVAGEITSSLDLTGDDLIDAQDLATFLELSGTVAGDTNFDQQVDFSDFLLLSSNFGNLDSHAWSDGNFDCNRHVEFGDFLALSKNFGFAADPMSVPEPQSMGWIAAVAAVLLAKSRLSRKPQDKH